MPTTSVPQAFSGEPTVIVISGPAGAGKSRLVAAWGQQLLPDASLFGAGKIDRARQATPFGALSAALDEVVRQILAGGVEEVEVWRRIIQAALGKSAQIVIDLAGGLGLLLGPQA